MTYVYYTTTEDDVVQGDFSVTKDDCNPFYQYTVYVHEIADRDNCIFSSLEDYTESLFTFFREGVVEGDELISETLNIFLSKIRK